MAQRKSTAPAKADGRAADPAKARAAEGTKARAAKPASRRGIFTATQRRELVGSLLVALAVITLMAFVSDGGRVSQWWAHELRRLFGSGAAVFAIFAGLLGAWLIREGVDDRGPIAWERPVGGAVFLLCLLGLVHVASVAMSDGRSGRMLAESLEGGGWVGYGVSTALVANLGRPSSIVALLLVGIVAASFMAGLTVRQSADMTIRAARRSAGGVRGGGPRLIARRPRRIPAASPLMGPSGAPEGTVQAAAAVPSRRREPTMVGAPTPAIVASASANTPWQLPGIHEVLDLPAESGGPVEDTDAMARLIESTLAEFGIPVRVVEVNRGPTVTQFGLEPGYVDRGGVRQKVKVSQIVALQNDLSLALSASPIRVQAPVPGRPYVGVEVPNAASSLVALREVLEHEAFRRVAERGVLPVALGRDTSGRPVAADLSDMPHLLVAGATGSGKSVMVNTLICSLTITHTPATLKLLLIDPKRVEMAAFRGLPHLAAPVVVDVERVVGVLQWAVREMDRRYKEFASVGARNIATYNRQFVERHEPPLPYLVIIVDELADLMMTAPEETERLVTRLAQLARATGIHLVIATQRPSVDVVTGLIKANFPARIAFAVSSSVDSRVILDSVGAEKLLGRGDMLYQASDSSRLRRLQGCYVSDNEIERLVRFWRNQSGGATSGARQPLGLPEPLIQAELWDAMMAPAGAAGADARDPLWDEAVTLISRQRTASTSFLQRKLRIGYSRAARLLDQLEAEGLVGPAQGNSPREVRVDIGGESSPASEASDAGLAGASPEGDRGTLPPWTDA